jgi:hypothetical protein
MTLGLLVGRFGTFIRENHTPNPAPPPESPFPPHLNRLREKVAHHLIPLVLIARSDREFLDSERDVIVSHCLSVAGEAGLALDGSETELLDAYVASFHPSLMQLDPALQRLGRCPHGEVAGLLNAAQAVISADGRVTPEEARLLAELQEELAALASA